MGKDQARLKLLLIEHDRSDPSDSSQTPQVLTNEESITMTSERQPRVPAARSPSRTRGFIVLGWKRLEWDMAYGFIQHSSGCGR